VQMQDKNKNKTIAYRMIHASQHGYISSSSSKFSERWANCRDRTTAPPERTNRTGGTSSTRTTRPASTPASTSAGSTGRSCQGSGSSRSAPPSASPPATRSGWLATFLRYVYSCVRFSFCHSCRSDERCRDMACRVTCQCDFSNETCVFCCPVVGRGSPRSPAWSSPSIPSRFR
jgi:hypothetical protein